MKSLHNENFILTLDAYSSFTQSQNFEYITKKITKMRIMSIVQVVLGALIVAGIAFSKAETMKFFVIIGVAVAAWGVFGFVKSKGYYEKSVKSIEKSYYERGFDKSKFNVNFHADRMSYYSDGELEELMYEDFYNIYDSDKFFAIHFTSGKLIIFNPDCSKEKIRDIVYGYVDSHKEAEVTEE